LIFTVEECDLETTDGDIEAAEAAAKNHVYDPRYIELNGTSGAASWAVGRWTYVGKGRTFKLGDDGKRKDSKSKFGKWLRDAAEPGEGGVSSDYISYNDVESRWLITREEGDHKNRTTTIYFSSDKQGASLWLPPKTGWTR